MRIQNKRGFTLVELLVVIGIIALLIAMLMPSLTKARRSAIAVRCMSNLRQFQMQSQNYANENAGYYLPILEQSFAYGTTYNWAQDPALRKWLRFPLSTGFYMGAGVRQDQICGEATLAMEYNIGDGLRPVTYSYGMNYSDFNDPARNRNMFWGNTAPFPLVPAVSYNSARIRYPANKIAWADSIGFWFERNNSQTYIGETSAPGACIAYRHNKGVNIVFFDGHGELRPRKLVDKTYLNANEIDSLWFALRK